MMVQRCPRLNTKANRQGLSCTPTPYRRAESDKLVPVSMGEQEALLSSPILMSAIKVCLPDREVLQHWAGVRGLMAISPTRLVSVISSEVQFCRSGRKI